MTDAYPLRLEPQVKEIVWGGRWLVDTLGRQGPNEAKLGESWEAYSGSVITNSKFKGRTLGVLFEASGAKLLGQAAANYPKFPLLVKFIDANENLSVQVHPDDRLAQQLENYPFGKTEFWYVMEAEPGAEICFSLNSAPRNREDLRNALESGELLKYIQKCPVRPGDVVFLPAGTVHALTKGIVVYELQQDCDITYRLYDWGRVGRQIHIDKGLLSINMDYRNLPITHPEPIEVNGYRKVTLVNCDYFVSDLVLVENGEAAFKGDPNSFALISVIEGEGSLAGDFEAENLKKGDTVLAPAGLDYRLTSSGKLSVISSTMV